MKLLISTISEKGQTTIPASVRKALNLKAGEGVVYEIEKNNIVRIKKLDAAEMFWAKSQEHTLEEWLDDKDDDI